jgi:hypothetical protein
VNGTRRLLEHQPTTVPLNRAEPPPAAPHPPADAVCGWCNIRTAAIPDTPVLIEDQWFHPTSVCLRAAWRRRVIQNPHPLLVQVTP